MKLRAESPTHTMYRAYVSGFQPSIFCPVPTQPCGLGCYVGAPSALGYGSSVCALGLAVASALG